MCLDLGVGLCLTVQKNKDLATQLFPKYRSEIGLKLNLGFCIVFADYCILARQFTCFHLKYEVLKTTVVKWIEKLHCETSYQS